MARKLNNNMTFVEITNQSIYDKVLGVDLKMEALSKKLDESIFGFNEKLGKTSDELKAQIEKNRTDREFEIEKVRGVLYWHQWLMGATLATAGFAVTLLVQHLLHP